MRPDFLERKSFHFAILILSRSSDICQRRVVVSSQQATPDTVHRNSFFFRELTQRHPCGYFPPQAKCGDSGLFRQHSIERKNTMKQSTERILTTHVGSLARADSLIPLLRLREEGQNYDREELARLVREAVSEVVRKQVEAGIDIVTDGEQGKSGFFGYVIERFNGFERKPPAPGKEMRPRAAGREYLAFPAYYAWSERIAEPFGGRSGRRGGELDVFTRAGRYRRRVA